jgi:hypothetical protein
MEDKITKLVETYCTRMNEICWYSNGYYWNRDNLMDLTTYECKVRDKCPPVAICKSCENLKKDFHERFNILIKLNKSKTERKWKK